MSEPMTHDEFQKLSGEGFYHVGQTAAETRSRIEAALKDRERMILSAQNIDAMIEELRFGVSKVLSMTDTLYKTVNRDFPIMDEVTP